MALSRHKRGPSLFRSDHNYDCASQHIPPLADVIKTERPLPKDNSHVLRRLLSILLNYACYCSSFGIKVAPQKPFILILISPATSRGSIGALNAPLVCVWFPERSKSASTRLV